jgi:hypothetical protein
MGSLFWLNQMGPWALVAIVIIGFLIAILFLRLLWNSTFPDLFEFKKISYWQSLKILLLAMLLFGGGSSLVSLTKNTISETDLNSEGGINSVTTTESSSLTIGN